MQLKIGGKKVFFTSLGSGKQLLILPGWMHDHNIWQKVQNQLSANLQVTVLDFPGFGESENNPDIKDLNDYARFLCKVITELRLTDFILLGHSFGGSVAIKTLSLYPKLPIDKLILVDSAGMRHFHVKRIFGFLLAKSAKPIFSLPILKNYTSQARRILYGTLKEEDYLAAGPLKSVLSRVVKENLEGLLDRIKVATLIIWGEKDNATPLEHAHILQNKIKKTKLVVIKNATHWPFLERQEEFCQIVTKFINE